MTTPTTAPQDVAKGISALAALVSSLAHGTLDLTTFEAAVDSVQKVAVEFGLEPPEISAAISTAEFLLPALKLLAASGIGGVPGAFPPGGGPSYIGR